MGDCPHHEDHETRISRLEKERETPKVSPVVWASLIGLVGVIFNAVGTFLGDLIKAFTK